MSEFQRVKIHDTVFAVVQKWDNGSNVGGNFTLFSNKEDARKCLQYLIELDNHEGITEDIGESPDDWIVTQSEDSYDAVRSYSDSNYIEIEIREMRIWGWFNPELTEIGA